MIKIKIFTYGPFQQNMTVLWDETKECVIIDPAMYTPSDEKEFSSFLSEHDLKPVALLNTHCHIDHVMGNRFVAETYHLKVQAHALDVPTLEQAKLAAELYQINYTSSPDISIFLEEGQKINFGKSTLDILFTPGHAPGHVVFISHDQKFVINGDVLFRRSVGRVDLPGSNPKDLIKSIQEKMYKLPDDYEVYCGHGPNTTIGYEKENNPFVNENTAAV